MRARLDEAARRRLEGAVGRALLEALPPAAPVEILDVAVGQLAQPRAVAEVPAWTERTGADGLAAVGAGEGEVDTAAPDRKVDRRERHLARVQQRPRRHVAGAPRGVERRLLAHRRRQLPTHALELERRALELRRGVVLRLRGAEGGAQQAAPQLLRQQDADRFAGEQLARLVGYTFDCLVAARAEGGGVLLRAAHVVARRTQVGDHRHLLGDVEVVAILARVRGLPLQQQAFFLAHVAFLASLAYLVLLAGQRHRRQPFERSSASPAAAMRKPPGPTDSTSSRISSPSQPGRPA